MRAVIESPDRLVRQARAGEPEARRQLYDALVEPVRAFLHGLRLDLSAVELQDAIQDTFVRLFGRLDRLEHADAVQSYALGIARHVALDRLRKRGRREQAAGSGIDRLADTTDVPGEVARGERDRLVAETLDALTADQRAVLTLRHINGLTMEQLAQTLGCSVPTARSRLRSAARALAGQLRQRGVLPREERP